MKKSIVYVMMVSFLVLFASLNGLQAQVRKTETVRVTVHHPRHHVHHPRRRVVHHPVVHHPRRVHRTTVIIKK